jgi:hypothetical protein
MIIRAIKAIGVIDIVHVVRLCGFSQTVWIKSKKSECGSKGSHCG